MNTFKKKQHNNNVLNKHYIFWRGDKMKAVKGLTLMTIGGLAVLAYQKYKDPLMNQIDCIIGQKM